MVVNSTNFNYSLLDRHFAYSNQPKDEVRFLFVSGVREDAVASAKMFADIHDFDFAISAGEMTTSRTDRQLYKTFSPIDKQQTVYLEVDDDSHRDARGHYYQEVNGVQFYFLNVQLAQNAADEDTVDQALEWLENELTLHRNGVKFVVSPTPVYSTGCAGASAAFAPKMEAFLLRHQDSRIAGVLTGGDHIFSAFRLGDTQIIVGGSGGGELDRVNSLECVSSAERAWNASELHGALEESENAQTTGYGHHLDSYATHARTEVSVTDAEVRFVVRETDTYQIL